MEKIKYSLETLLKNREDCLKYLENRKAMADPIGLEAVRLSVELIKRELEQEENDQQQEKSESLEPKRQQPIPQLKNNDQRKEWLRNYQAWGLWYEDEHIGARYYKYDFDNGTQLIAEEYPAFGNRDITSSYLHLVGGPEPPKHPSYGCYKWNWHKRYNKYPDSETELLEFLKAIQR